CCSQFFFFFQAEDGIRDSSVTGVQTCALPICGSRVGLAFGGALGVLYSVTTISGPPLAVMLSNQGFTKRDFRAGLGLVRLAESRSEERRVGKGWRGRWWPWAQTRRGVDGRREW